MTNSFFHFSLLTELLAEKRSSHTAGAELGYIRVFEGGELDRRWRRVQKEKTQKAAQVYMAAVRVYVEGMLKLMLRGEDVKVPTFVFGGFSREAHCAAQC